MGSIRLGGICAACLNQWRYIVSDIKSKWGRMINLHHEVHEARALVLVIVGRWLET